MKIAILGTVHPKGLEFLKENELEIVDGKTLYNGKNYSGIAIQKDNQDNIRVEEKYNDGIKFHTKLFYTEGSMQSEWIYDNSYICLLYTSPSPRDLSTSRMPSSA